MRTTTFDPRIDKIEDAPSYSLIGILRDLSANCAADTRIVDIDGEVWLPDMLLDATFSGEQELFANDSCRELEEYTWDLTGIWRVLADGTTRKAYTITTAGKLMNAHFYA